MKLKFLRLYILSLCHSLLMHIPGNQMTSVLGHYHCSTTLCGTGEKVATTYLFAVSKQIFLCLLVPSFVNMILFSSHCRNLWGHSLYIQRNTRAHACVCVCAHVRVHMDALGQGAKEIALFICSLSAQSSSRITWHRCLL